MKNMKNFTALMRAAVAFRSNQFYSSKFDPRVGLCPNLHNFDVKVDWPKLHAAFRKWPEFSGSVVNPVPHIKGLGLWEGRNGELRVELMKFLVAHEYKFLMSEQEIADHVIEDEMLSAVGGE